MIFKKKLLIKLIKILISLLILSAVYFFINQFVADKVKMPYNYDHIIK
tara:strand:+ start:1557 stop:1700 length:144 start_codon:yes stop_codon:yes gene_type:complete